MWFPNKSLIPASSLRVAPWELSVCSLHLQVLSQWGAGVPVVAGKLTKWWHWKQRSHRQCRAWGAGWGCQVT